MKGELVNMELENLSFGPSRYVSSFKGCIVNGFRFHTKDREVQRKTQNSGVFVSADTSSFSSAKDVNPVTGSVGYYGVLKDIVELCYLGGNRVLLFKCDWFDVLSRAGIKRDEYGFTTLNFTRRLATNEPFILATQAQQVFYLKDNLNENWRVVLKTEPRDLYDMGEKVEMNLENGSNTHQDVTNIISHEHTIDDWTRNEMEGIEVVADTTVRDGNVNDQDFIDDSSCDEYLTDESDEDDFIED